MYTYKSTCRFKMLVYSGSDILEIRPQQTIESDIKIEHSYLKLINRPAPKPLSKRKYTKKNTKENINHGNDRKADNEDLGKLGS